MSLHCKGCTERKVGCHATCPDYLARALKNEMRRKKIREENYLNEVSCELSRHRQKTRRII